MGSTIALAEAAALESAYLPAGWEIKVVAGGEEPDAPAPAARLISADERTGEVVAIVGVTGIVDHVNDLIEPGAYGDTLAKRRPKVCWAHSWESPIGGVRQIEEWRPGDPRFAQVKATLDGRPWPAEAGALVARMRFNLKSERGREAFAAVEFYSETGECEWSIGWQPVPAATVRRKDGVRVCRKVELFEVSPVLFGAAPLTRTLEVKSLNLHAATRGALAARAGAPAGDPADEEAARADLYTDTPPEDATPTPVETDPTDEAALHRSAMDEIDWAAVDAAANPGAELPPGPGTPAVAADPTAQPAADTLDPADDPEDPEDPEDAVDGGADEAEEDAAAAAEEDAADGGADDDDEDADGGKKKKPASSAPPWVKKKGAGVLLDAKSLAAFTDGLELAALGVVLPEIKAEGGADRNRGNAEQLRHWYVQGGGAAEIAWGTPGDFARCTAIAGKHMDPERAKGYCNLRHKDALGIYPATHAAAERGKAFAAADRLAKTWNPLLEVGAYAAHGSPQRKFLAEGIDGLRGSFEARQAKLREGLEPVLRDAIGWKKPKPVAAGDGDGMVKPGDDCWVSVDGTWPDRVVATVCRYGEERAKQTFVVPYTFDGDDVTFGKPTPVELQVSIVPAAGGAEPDADDLFAGVTDDDDDDGGGVADALMLPAIGLLSSGAGAMKAALIHSPEVKAGRVLSEANATRLRGALEHLLEVARSAGIDLPGWTGPDRDPGDDGALPDTTAPAYDRPPAAATARPAVRGGVAVKVLTPDQIAAQLDELTAG